MALVLITHDTALVAGRHEICHVRRAGRRAGAAQSIFRAPRHPHTRTAARVTRFCSGQKRVWRHAGCGAGKYDRPTGLSPAFRAAYATDRCRAEEPALNQLDDGRQSKCHYPLDDAGRPTL